MRRATVLFFAVVMLMGAVAACSSGPSAPTGTAAEVADKIFTEAGVEAFGPMSALETADQIEFFLGSNAYPTFADSAVVQPFISIDTRMLYVLKASDEKDVDEIMTQLEEDIDPNKLICVTFSLEDVVIASRGDVIFMTINSDEEQRTALAAAFETIE